MLAELHKDKDAAKPGATGQIFQNLTYRANRVRECLEAGPPQMRVEKRPGYTQRSLRCVHCGTLARQHSAVVRA